MKLAKDSLASLLNTFEYQLLSLDLKKAEHEKQYTSSMLKMVEQQRKLIDR